MLNTLQSHKWVVVKQRFHHLPACNRHLGSALPTAPVLKVIIVLTAYLAPAFDQQQRSLAVSGRQLLTPLAVVGFHTCGAADCICKVLSMLAFRWLGTYSMLSRDLDNTEPSNLRQVRKHRLAFLGWGQLNILRHVCSHSFRLPVKECQIGH